MDQQVRCYHHLRNTQAVAGIRDIQPLQIRMIQYGIRRLADRDPPQVLTCVHVDRGNAAVRRLENIQPVGTAHTEAT